MHEQLRGVPCFGSLLRREEPLLTSRDLVKAVPVRAVARGGLHAQTLSQILCLCNGGPPVAAQGHDIKCHLTFVQGRRGERPSACLFSETSAPVANRVTTPVGRWSAGASDGRTGGLRKTGRSELPTGCATSHASLTFFELGRVPCGADRHRAHFEGTRIFLATAFSR